MANLETQALRALRKLYAPHARAREKSAYYDAMYDSGEWSAGAHSAAEEDEYSAAVALVARRFGLSVKQLENAACAADWRELDYTQAGHTGLN